MSTSISKGLLRAVAAAAFVATSGFAFHAQAGECPADKRMDKVTPQQEGTAQTQVSRERSPGFYRAGNTSVPGVGVDKDDTTPKSK